MVMLQADPALVEDTEIGTHYVELLASVRMLTVLKERGELGVGAIYAQRARSAYRKLAFTPKAAKNEQIMAARGKLSSLSHTAW